MPGCMAYGGFGGQLFIGIRGDLYRMNCAQFLPHKYQQMVSSELTLLLTKAANYLHNVT